MHHIKKKSWIDLIVVVNYISVINLIVLPYLSVIKINLNEMNEMSLLLYLRNPVLILPLSVQAMGINDLLSFDFMDAPPMETLITAMEQLYTLGALDDEGLLTRLGRRVRHLCICLADFSITCRLFVIQSVNSQHHSFRSLHTLFTSFRSLFLRWQSFPWSPCCVRC